MLNISIDNLIQGEVGVSMGRGLADGALGRQYFGSELEQNLVPEISKAT